MAKPRSIHVTETFIDAQGRQRVTHIERPMTPAEIEAETKRNQEELAQRLLEEEEDEKKKGVISFVSAARAQVGRLLGGKR